MPTIAGTGVAGFSGDNGPATAAQLNVPWGLAIDGSGNIFIADVLNARIRRVSPGGCTIAASARNVLLDSGTATGSFQVNAAPACAYTAAGDSSWIHVTSGAAGQTSGSVQYSVDSNTGGSARTGTVIVSASGSTATYTVYQAGAGCQYTINPPVLSLAFWALGSQAQVVQTPSGCAAWQATSDSKWLQITNGTLSAGGAGLQYIAYNNPSPLPRTAIVTVGNQTESVIQDASPIVLTAPLPGTTLSCATPRFAWTTLSNAGFRYEVGTTLGGADLASGSVTGGSATISGLPLNGKPVFFRLWYSLGGAWQPVPIDAAYITATATAAPANCPVGGTLSDFDSNGVPDLVWMNNSMRQVNVNYFGGAGGAMLIGWNSLPGALGWHVAAVADFDSNGIPDLVWQNDTTGQVNVNYYGGSGRATLIGYNILFSSSAPGWHIVGAGDFDNNGTPDLVWQNDSTGQVNVTYFGGAGGASLTGFAVLYPAGSAPGWRVAAVADFNGDGVPDIVWQNNTNGQVNVNYLGGAGGASVTGFNVLYGPGAAPGWHVVGALDMDNNGTPDVLWQNDSSGQVNVNYFGGPGGATLIGFNVLYGAGSTNGWTLIN